MKSSLIHWIFPSSLLFADDPLITANLAYLTVKLVLGSETSENNRESGKGLLGGAGVALTCLSCFESGK
jgi:hypothetical protein